MNEVRQLRYARRSYSLVRLVVLFLGFTTAVLSTRPRRRCRLSSTLTAALPFADSANGASYAQRNGA